jgi:hypothetical protein
VISSAKGSSPTHAPIRSSNCCWFSLGQSHVSDCVLYIRPPEHMHPPARTFFKSRGCKMQEVQDTHSCYCPQALPYRFQHSYILPNHPKQKNGVTHLHICMTGSSILFEGHSHVFSPGLLRPPVHLHCPGFTGSFTKSPMHLFMSLTASYVLGGSQHTHAHTLG